MTGPDLREARQSLGLTQQELAARLGVSRASVNRWETGAWPVPPMVALAAQHLGKFVDQPPE